MIRLRRKGNITVAEIMALHSTGLIGTIESRSWLANEFPAFEKARRDDIDKTLENLGTEMQNNPILKEEDEEEFGD